MPLRPDLRGPDDPDDAEEHPVPLAMATGDRSAARPSPPPPRSPPPAPRRVERGLVLFDLDGTILDDLALIGDVAADVLEQTFGTPAVEGRIHYLATTGMPFEAQLAQLYPAASAATRGAAARTFHERKIREAYARAAPFPEIPRVLKQLAGRRWTLAVTTGAETEMAEIILERVGLRFWFDGVLGSADGTKREHIVEYQRRYPDARTFLVGDSRFDMEAALSVAGVVPLARATRLSGWTLTPSDLEGWGAAWADYSLGELPEALERLARPARPAKAAGGRPARRRRS